MQSQPNPSKVPSPGWRRTIAVLVAASVAVAACGSESELPEAEVSVGTSDATGRGDVEYGASLEEWAGEADQATPPASEPESAPQTDDGAPEGYEEVTWEDLLPPGYSTGAIFARYQDRLNALADGSPEAEAIYAEMQAEYDASSGDINEELNGAKVNLAGFVAPLNNDGTTITEFLLVPYFGACIHVPAPPPNQTVLVRVDEANGLTFEESWGAVWVAGTLTLDPTTTDLATASYIMTDATSGVYDLYG